MKLKNLLVGSFLLFSGIINGQEKLHFDVYSRGDFFFSPKLKIGYFEKKEKEVNFSFLFGAYSIDFKKINDSTYREIVDVGLWKRKKEVFEYSFNGSCYKLEEYYSMGDEPRLEKERLEGKIFDKKYGVLPEIFNNLEKNQLGDSIHFVLLGVPYSTRIKTEKEGKDFIFSSDLEFIEEKPDDVVNFSSPVKVKAKKKNGKLLPYNFSTMYKRVKSGRMNYLEGKLID